MKGEHGAAQETHGINYTCSLFPATNYLYSVIFFIIIFFTHEELEDDLSYNVVKTGIKFQKSKQL